MKIDLISRVLVLCICLIAGKEVAAAGMPDFYAEPGLNPNRSLNQSTDFDAVDPFTGKLQLHHTDIFIPGNGGMDLEVSRHYTSGNIVDWGFGYSGWTMGFGYVEVQTLHPVCTSIHYVSNRYNPVLVLSDGSHHILGDVDMTTSIPNNYTYITNSFWKADCPGGSGGGLIVTSPEGDKYEMTFAAGATVGTTSYTRWYVTKITDRNGNWFNITYTNPNGNGALVSSVTTSDGRTLTYSYNGMQLASISTGSGTWQYSYIDGATVGLSVGTYLLSKVTLPDSTTWEYTYNGNLGVNTDPALYGGNAIIPGSYQIKSVKTPQGGVINYAYSYALFNASPGYVADVVVSTRTIPGTGVWTYDYIPSTGPNVFDKTTVSMVAGGVSRTDTFTHFGYNTVAANSVLGGCSNEMWKIGLLASKSIGSTQTEQYSWGVYAASNSQLNVRSFGWTTKFDCGLYYPVLLDKTITRDGAAYVTAFSNYDGYGNAGTVTETGPGGTSRVKYYNFQTGDASTMWIVHQQSYEFYNGLNHTLIMDGTHNVLFDSKAQVTTAYTYNPDGTVATMTPPGNAVYTYDEFGNPTLSSTPYSTTYGISKRGIPQTEAQPDGINISRIVSDAGVVTSETNGNSKTTVYSYDGLNRLTSITHPINNPVSIGYSANRKTATRGSLVEDTTYDGFGRPTSVSLGGIVTTYQYDALGRMTFKSDPNSTAGTTYTYDQIGRVTKLAYADGSSKDTTYASLRTTVKDENGNSTIYNYYAYGDPDQTFLTSITTPDPAANITIVRDNLDNVSSVTQAGVTRVYVIQANGYLYMETNPESGTTIYGRNEAGSMTYRLAGAVMVAPNAYTGIQTLYTYDNHNRLTQVDAPSFYSSIANTYSNTHKLLSSSYFGSTPSTRSFTYDDNDNLLTDNILVDAYNLSVGYSYNSNDQISTITYPISGQAVTVTPDVLGRPTAVSGYVTNATYWDSGQVKQISYQNGAVSSYGQNARLWPSSFSTQSSAGALINSSYTYDLVGNLTSISDGTTPAFNRVFGYDALDRLTTVNASGSWGAGSIGYDGAGNITSQTYGTSGLTYTYSQNRLTSVAGTLRNASYTYDMYGDIVSDGAGKTFTYDEKPILIRVSDTNSGSVTTYAYDGLNKRVKVIKNGVATYEFNDLNGKLLAEYTPSQGNMLTEYMYLGGMRIAQRIGNH